jgi:glycerol-3-phosphate acyltransferase PlsY
MTAALLLPALVLALQGVSTVFWLALALGLFVVFAHRANIRRLLRGEEHRFSRKAATR